MKFPTHIKKIQNVVRIKLRKVKNSETYQLILERYRNFLYDFTSCLMEFPSLRIIFGIVIFLPIFNIYNKIYMKYINSYLIIDSNRKINEEIISIKDKNRIEYNEKEKIKLMYSIKYIKLH